jgi:hypothetical protein
MARSVKNPFMLVLVLLVVISVLSYAVYSGSEGFRAIDCDGINCPEGEFCQSNKCQAIYPPETNKY